MIANRDTLTSLFSDVQCASVFTVQDLCFSTYRDNSEANTKKIEREMVKLILSKQGQSIVAKDGYIPLPAKVVKKTMKKLGL